ncbi:hypothetical protein ZIOFF_070614 [Zingiber officinale]|uniref:Uncharacterized protein n=1 Tax=Zingiber officinale TaxID=94328 RepID=A0A8J5CAM9_ZINOF|nr:hypothetical protein ZIOFF_070614 [Zingiber officinale]
MGETTLRFTVALKRRRKASTFRYATVRSLRVSMMFSVSSRGIESWFHLLDGFVGFECPSSSREDSDSIGSCLEVLVVDLTFTRWCCVLLILKSLFCLLRIYAWIVTLKLISCRFHKCGTKSDAGAYQGRLLGDLADGFGEDDSQDMTEDPRTE